VAPDVQHRVEEIANLLPEFSHVDAARVLCFRSRGAVARIYARIWGLHRIWQLALGVEALYAIEVVEAFDRSPMEEQDRTLIHELMHIPKTMSGALVPHRCFGQRIDCDSVEPLARRLAAARRAAKESRGEGDATDGGAVSNETPTRRRDDPLPAWGGIEGQAEFGAAPQPPPPSVGPEARSNVAEPVSDRPAGPAIDPT
jgi:predicted metallopeptidase